MAKLPDPSPPSRVLAVFLLSLTWTPGVGHAGLWGCTEAVELAARSTSYTTEFSELTELRRRAVTACSLPSSVPEAAARSLMMARDLPENFLDYAAHLRLLDRAVDVLEAARLIRSQVMIEVLDQRSITLGAMDRSLDSLADLELANEIRLERFGIGSEKWVQGQIHLAFHESGLPESHQVASGNEAAIRRLEATLVRVRNSPSRPLETQQELLALIAGLYREAGEKARADQYQAERDALGGVGSRE